MEKASALNFNKAKHMLVGVVDSVEYYADEINFGFKQVKIM